MKLNICLYVIAGTTLLVPGCDKNKDIEEQRYTWTTDAPLSIPYRTRLQRFEKGNLIRNFSFENGRTFTLDSTRTSFVIDGWQQIGQHIQWVDTRNDSLFDSDEAYSGYRSVKIIRKTAHETDSRGEGIISEFIKVIPGNYSLSFYARLEHVMPNRSRLGTRMFDGVDISLQYFDRNKIPISPDYKYPQENQVINNSFKALSFANYRDIPTSDWGKVTCKSQYFPFPDGDIPSDAHFVKIFIGLKGSGTLWVDSVSFQYTDHNFSVAERMGNYTDTAFRVNDAFIPQPKKIFRMESILFYKSEMAREDLPVIIIPFNPSVVESKTAALIRTALTKSISQFNHHRPENAEIFVIKDNQDIPGANKRLIISIGKTKYFNEYGNVIPRQEISGRSQGYLIYTPGDRPNLVMLTANSDTGLYYASLTTIQMIDNKAPVFHNARIIDYPDFPGRFYTIDHLNNPAGIEMQEEFAAELSAYKFNGALVLHDSGRENQVKPANISFFDILPVRGYKTPDDSTLTYRFPVEEDNSVQLTGNYVIPACSNNQLLDNSGYPDLLRNAAGNLKYLYSGCSFFSENTDAWDIRRYTSVMGPKPVFMDNSMLISTAWGHYGGNDHFYPGKIRLFNLFQPFADTGIMEFMPLLDTSLFVVNQPVSSEIEIVRLATAADFMWNAKQYSAGLSLWKVLLTRYGAENARSLIIYAEKYSLMLEILLKLRLNLQVARNTKTGQQIMSELTSILADLSIKMGSQKKLVKELQTLNAGLRNHLNQNTLTLPVKK